MTEAQRAADVEAFIEAGRFMVRRDIARVELERRLEVERSA